MKDKDMNINLNFGGVVGALFCAGLAIVLTRNSTAMIPALLSGAFGGNALWSSLFKRP